MLHQPLAVIQGIDSGAENLIKMADQLWLKLFITQEEMELIRVMLRGHYHRHSGDLSGAERICIQNAVDKINSFADKMNKEKNKSPVEPLSEEALYSLLCFALFLNSKLKMDSFLPRDLIPGIRKLLPSDYSRDQYLVFRSVSKQFKAWIDQIEIPGEYLFNKNFPSLSINTKKPDGLTHYTYGSLIEKLKRLSPEDQAQLALMVGESAKQEVNAMLDKSICLEKMHAVYGMMIGLIAGMSLSAIYISSLSTEKKIQHQGAVTGICIGISLASTILGAALSYAGVRGYVESFGLHAKKSVLSALSLFSWSQTTEKDDAEFVLEERVELLVSDDDEPLLRPGQHTELRSMIPKSLNQ